MKKSTKILGSVALSAALVMGTAVPAFAKTGTEYDDFNTARVSSGADGIGTIELGENGAAGTGTTTVNIDTYTSQISVTVPLVVTFALDTVGGAGYAPTDGAYKIINNTDVPVHVQSAAVTPATGNGEANLSFAAAEIVTPTAYTGTDNGQIYAKFEPTATTGGTAEKDLLITSATNDNADLGWIIAAKPSGTTTVKVLQVGSTKYATPADAQEAIDAGTITVSGSSKHIGAAFAGVIEANQSGSWADAAFAPYLTATGGSATFVEDTAGATDASSNISFKISVSSTPLKNLTNSETGVKAASIVYTVDVKAKA